MNPAKLHIFHFVTFDTLEREYGLYLAYTMLSLGGAIFAVTWAGCCGAVKDNSCLLALVSLLLSRQLIPILGIQRHCVAVVTAIWRFPLSR